MTRSAALARIGMSSGRWLLPWIAVVLVSATLAYAMSSAIARSASPSDQPADLQVALSRREPTGAAVRERSTSSLSATSADPGPTLVPESCLVSSQQAMYAGVDWWIVAESRKLACEPGGP
jgi:hypothetical protein